jgi:hypothetical protein
MKLLKYILLVAIVCMSVLSVMQVLYRQGQNKFLKVKNPIGEMLNGDTNYDILFIGSSRTTFHVNPRIVDSITNLNTYNAGHYAANIVEMNLMLQCYLQKHIPPKLLVADFSVNSFHISESAIYSPVDYFPYIGNATVNNVVCKYHSRAWLWKYLPFLEICEATEMQKVQAVCGLLGKKESGEAYKGYKENGSAFISPQLTYEDNTDYEFTPKALHILEELIRTCKSNNIQLLFTYSPEFHLLHHKKENSLFKIINNFSQAYNVPFYNYRSHTISGQYIFFKDPVHLNTNGATAFSTDLAQKIDKEFQFSNKEFNKMYYTQNSF